MALHLDSDSPHLDQLYQALVDLESELDAQELEAARSALLLLLAHQIDDLETVKEAIALARSAATRAPGSRPS